jgi:DNA-binding NtrC family response regulator
MKTLLLIEDDDISRRFLTEAITLLPVVWHACTGFSEAGRLCSERHYDLIITDVNAQDGSLFECIGLLPDSCKKLAISAGLDAETNRQLHAIGVQESLEKPLTIAALHSAIGRLLDDGQYASAPLPIWDHETALKALGHNERILATLKEMFRQELPVMIGQIDLALINGDHADIHATLHKLKASCGFLGAKELLDLCNRLDAEINQANLLAFKAGAARTLTIT